MAKRACAWVLAGAVAVCLAAWLTRRVPVPASAPTAAGHAHATVRHPEARSPGPIRPATAAVPSVRSIPASAAASPAPSADDSIAAFGAWAGRYAAAGAAGRAGLVPEGLRLAADRREAMARLIRQDPRRAIAAAVPYATRQGLPPDIAALLETPVSGDGRYEVIVACGLGAPGTHDALVRQASLGAARYTVYTYGRRLDVTTKFHLSMHGVALGGDLALDESPVRVLDAAECAARGLSGEGVVMEVAGRFAAAASAERVAAVESALIRDERRLGPYAASPTADGPAVPDAFEAPGLASAWTEGPKTLLYIRCRFADEDIAFDPVSLGTVQGYQAVVDQFMRNASYGKTSITNTFTDTVTLPQVASVYTSNFSLLLSDAAQAARTANPAWEVANFALYIVVTSNKGNFSYAGISYVGSKGCHLRADYTSLRTAGHELGHNLGLWHANYWRTDSTSPIGRDAVPGGYVGDTVNAEWIEYGHRFSLMSGMYNTDMNSADKPHYAVTEKMRLNWLATNDVGVVSAGGTYRIYRQDHPSATGIRGIKIDVASSDYTGYGRKYWLSYRRQPFTAGGDATTWAPYGVQVDWAKDAYGSDGTVLLDMTPYSNDDNAGASYNDDNADKDDSFLLLGRTYTDAGADLHFTPVSCGGSAPSEWIDVVVNRGTQSGDRPPQVALMPSATQVAAGQAVTLTASASDPDGDPLAYAWDFDDHSLVAPALNSPTATKSWNAAGQYRVRVTASDMKGGTASDSVLVTVGTSSNVFYQIRGRVLWGGRPVSDARVNIGTTRQAWTDSDGTYALSSLAAGGFTVNCALAGLTFTRQFASALTVGPNAYGKDFWANETYTGGGNTFSIGGTVTDLGAGVVGVTVRAGGKRAITDASGAYVIAGLLNGSYSVTAEKTNVAFTPATRTVSVSGANVSGADFARVYYTVSGKVSGMAKTDPAPTITDGHRMAQSVYDSGKLAYTYSLQVPGGQWCLFATARGFSLTPNFIAPVTVSGNIANMDFTAAAGTVYRIDGTITDQYGHPATSAAVSDGSLNWMTDTEGYYRIAGVPAGTYTVTPAKTGWTFSPASRGVTVAADVTGESFAGTNPNTPPTVATRATATPSAVSSPAGFADLDVLGADNGGEEALTYRWVATTAPCAVAFSTNDVNAAKHTRATFAGAGNYIFEVSIRDAEGLTATDQVAVAVAGGGGPLITVSPYESEAAAGDLAAFAATGWDAVGTPSALTPVWSADGGSAISTAGVFRAGAAGGLSTVTAVFGGSAGAATVDVAPGSASAAIDSPANGQTFVQWTVVPLAATASDSAAVLSVAFRDGAGALASVAAPPYDFAWTNAAPGAHALRAVVYGRSGMVVTSAVVNVTVLADFDRDGLADIVDPDDDNDGMPDDWELAHNLNPTNAADRDDDPDGDHVPNWAEYVAGTDPRNKDSFLRVLATDEGSNVGVRFLGTTGRVYTVETRTNLLDAGGWSPIGQRIPTNFGTITVLDPAPGTRRFYRIKVERTP